MNGAAIDFATRDGTTRLLAGSMPRAGHPADVVVNQAFVDQFHRSVGDDVALATFAPEQGDEVQNGTYDPRGPVYRFHITGVVRVPQDIGIDEVHAIGRSADEGNLIGVQNSFYEAHRHEFLDFGAEYFLSLSHPRSGARALGDELASITPEGADAPLVLPVEDDSHRGALETPVASRPPRCSRSASASRSPAAIALALLLRTEQRVHDDDVPALRSLGATSRQLGTAAVVRTLPAAAAGTSWRSSWRSRCYRCSPSASDVSSSSTVASGSIRSPRRGLGPRARRRCRARLSVRTPARDPPYGAPSALRREQPAGGRRRTDRHPARCVPGVCPAGDPTIASVRPVIVGGSALVAIMAGLAVYGAGVDHAYATEQRADGSGTP